ncbi:fatty acid-biding protein [Trichoderma evansii]
MSDIFNGSYRLSKNENLDGFLSELGVGALKRKIIEAAKPTFTISKDGDMWHMTIQVGLQQRRIKFAMGEEFDDINIYDARVKSLITQDGNKWTQVQTPVDGSGNIIITVREFGEKQFKATMTVRNVTAVRIFDRL